jgi:hypothetical protein
MAENDKNKPEGEQYPRAGNPSQPATAADAKAAQGDATASESAKPQDGDNGDPIRVAVVSEDKKKGSRSGANKAKMLKAVGVEEEDVLSFNEETNTLVTAQGGKYQLSADGKKLKHLAGPRPSGKGE